jgi:signal transduction histidine kinase
MKNHSAKSPTFRTATLNSQATSVNEFVKTNKGLLSLLAHELRNPLAAITFSVNGLQDESLSASGKVLLDVLTRQLDHLNQVTESMLKLGKIQFSMDTQDSRRVNLNEIVAAAVGLMKFKTDQRNQQIDLKLTPENADVFGIPIQLTQSLANLIDNASKFAPIGSTIRMQTHRQHDQVHFVISDEGYGLSHDMCQRIFELFYRVPSNLSERPEKDDADKNVGYGLGLYLVRQLINNHNGTVECFSQGLGTGTTFTIKLPVANLPEDKTNQDQSQPQTRGDD